MSPLKEKIAGLIRAQGPLTIAQYMEVALGDPHHGYYIKRDPLGRDFTTAPEISQIYGELIGLFVIQAWEDRGRPPKLRLAELGPGRGTLMADMMRAATTVRPAFAEAARLVLVETSPVLRRAQVKALKRYSPEWVQHVGGIEDDAPLYLVANEFFDALPIRQFVRAEGAWHERMIVAEEDALRFALAPAPLASIEGVHADAPDGSIAEVNPSATAMVAEIAQRIGRSNGAALIIDYGYAEPALRDSFQAMKANGFADPLAEPGEADLTAHVDFAALKGAAEAAGTRVEGPCTQGAFLEALGIGARSARLKASAPEQASEIDAAVERLAGVSAMGNLFKAMAIAAPDSPPLPGFPC